MEKVFRETVEQLSKGDPVVLATVVRTKGSTPQKPGAKLLVRKDGSAVGTLGGGCVEGDIWFAAKELMKNGGPAEYRDYLLNEELAAKDGLICGGTMYFLIDPVYKPGSYLPYAEEIETAYNGGKPVALISLIKPAPNTSSSIGDKLFVREDGSTQGTLGNPELDSQAIKKGLELMAYGKVEYVKADNGAQYFVEAFTTPPQLVLMGGGHVSKSIAIVANTLGFRIFTIDDREQFSNKDRFPYAVETLVGSYEKAIERVPVNKNTFIVVATRGHHLDDVALEAAINTPASYVGLVGSKRKTLLIYEQLFKKGVPIDRIRQVRAPIGLDINARTPEEIAISIISEILHFRLGGSGKPMKMDDSLIRKAMEKAKASAVAG